MPTWSNAALRMSQRSRLVVGALVGGAAGAVTAWFAPWQLAVVAGWGVAALAITGSVWAFVPGLDGAATRAAAGREDLSTTTDDFVLLLASLVSLVGVVLTLTAARDESGALKAVMTVVAVTVVFVSWATVHTVFMLRYARLYYEAPEGGIDFGGEPHPDYLDFAYVAFTVGMTFQVSDTNVADRSLRRTITRHALLAFVFGTVIIGVTINVVGGLIS